MGFYYGNNPYHRSLYSPFADNMAGGMASLGSKIPEILGMYEKTMQTMAANEIRQQQLELQKQALENDALDRQEKRDKEKNRRAAFGEINKFLALPEEEGKKRTPEQVYRTAASIFYGHNYTPEAGDWGALGIQTPKDYTMTPYQEETLGMAKDKVAKEDAQHEAIRGAMQDPGFTTDQMGTLAKYGVNLTPKEILDTLKDKEAPFTPRSESGHLWKLFEDNFRERAQRNGWTEEQINNALAAQALKRMTRGTIREDSSGDIISTQNMELTDDVKTMYSGAPTPPPRAVPTPAPQNPAISTNPVIQNPNGTATQSAPLNPDEANIPMTVGPQAQQPPAPGSHPGPDTSAIPNNVKILPVAGYKLTQTELKDIRKQMADSQADLMNLEDVLGTIKEEDFNRISRMKFAIQNTKEKFGLGKAGEGAVRNSQIRADIQRGLNAYRKMVTGAQASTEEIEKYIQPSMPNYESDSYSTFIAKAQNYIADVKRLLSVQDYMIQHKSYSDAAFAQAIRDLRKEREAQDKAIADEFEEVN